MRLHPTCAAEPEISNPPTPSRAPVMDASIRTLPWWARVLAALGLVAIAAALRAAIKRRA